MNSEHEQHESERGTSAHQPLTPEEKIGKVILMTRWLQLPLLIGLVLALILFEVSFFKHLFSDVLSGKEVNRSKTVLLVLDLVDMVLIANLMVMVIISGYKIFICRVDLSKHGGLPRWLEGLTLAGVKYRIAATVLLISTIHVLHELLDTTVESFEGGVLILGVQFILVVTTCAFALIERWEKDDEQ